MDYELLQESTASEIAQAIGLIIAIGFTLMIPFVWIFGRTVALKKRPDQRALWTVGLAFAAASMILIFIGSDFISPFLAPFAVLPGALILFFWQRSHYRRGWVEDDEITDGMKLENDDWRVGVAVIVLLVIASTIKVLFLR